MDEQDHIVREFLVETYENLDELDGDLVALEDRGGDREILDKIFRTIHTIKGTCGFLGFGRLESVTHVGENLLSRLREGQASIDAETTTALLHMVDAVREMLGRIETTGRDGESDYASLLKLIARLTSSQPAFSIRDWRLESVRDERGDVTDRLSLHGELATFWLTES